MGISYRKHWGISAIALFSWAVAPAPAQIGPEDAVKLAPADTWGFVVIRDLQSTSKEIQSLASKFGMGDLDPLNYVKLNLGLPFEAIDESGSMALIVLDYSMYNDFPLVIAVPTRDPKDFIQQLGVQESEAGGPAFFIPQAGGAQRVYIASKGRFAVMGDDPNAVQAVASPTAQPLTLSRAMRDDLATRQMVVHANLVPIIATVKPMMMMMIGMGGMGGPGMGGGDPAQAERMATQQQALNQLIIILDQFKDLGLTLNIGAEGVSTELTLSFNENSELAGIFGDSINSSRPLLSGLPDGQFALTFGQKTGPEFLRKLTDLFKPLQQFAMQMGQPQVSIDTEAMAKYEEITNEMLSIATGQAVILGLPDAGAKGGIIRAAVHFMTTDSKRAVELISEMVPLMGSMFPDPDMAALTKALQYKPDAEQIAGMSVHHLEVDLAQIGEEVNEPPPPFIKKIIGSDVVRVRIAAVGPNAVAVAFGGGADYFSDVASLIKSRSAPLANQTTIREASRQLPNRRFVEMFLSLKGFESLYERLSESGAPVAGSISLPDGTGDALLAISISAAKQAARLSVFVPTDLIASISQLQSNTGGGIESRQQRVAPMPLPPVE